MTPRKPPQPSKKTEVSLVRSSVAESLTFITADGKSYKRLRQRGQDRRIVLRHLASGRRRNQLCAHCAA